MRTTVDRGIPARLLADPYTVRNLGGDSAADRTVGANALADGRAGHIGARRFGLPHRRKRQCADGGKNRRHQPGPAQESAAIETAGGLVSHCRSEIAATCLTFCSLDQHGCISLTSDNGSCDSRSARRSSSLGSEPSSCQHPITRPRPPWQAAQPRSLPDLRRRPSRAGSRDGPTFPFPVLSSPFPPLIRPSVFDPVPESKPAARKLLFRCP